MSLGHYREDERVLAIGELSRPIRVLPDIVLLVYTIH